MRHKEGHFEVIRNTRNYYQYWSPLDDPKAGLLILHGLGEHCGRYMNLVNRFVPLGYAVYGYDHIGHGKSDGPRVYVERFQDYTGVLDVFLDMIREWQSNKPIFLIGHSMGGLIGALYLLENQGKLSGAVFSGPGIKVPDNISGGIIFMGKILSLAIPKAGIIQLDAESISRDRAVVDAYRNDPLVYTGKITARLGAEMLKAMQHVTDNAKKIKLPVMIVQGGGDKLVDPSGAQMLYDSISSEDKSIKVYEGLYHEIFNEPEHEQVLNDVETWLAERAAGK